MASDAGGDVWWRLRLRLNVAAGWRWTAALWTPTQKFCEPLFVPAPLCILIHWPLPCAFLCGCVFVLLGLPLVCLAQCCVFLTLLFSVPPLLCVPVVRGRTLLSGGGYNSFALAFLFGVLLALVALSLGPFCAWSCVPIIVAVTASGPRVKCPCFSRAFNPCLVLSVLPNYCGSAGQHQAVPSHFCNTSVALQLRRPLGASGAPAHSVPFSHCYRGGQGRVTMSPRLVLAACQGSTLTGAILGAHSGRTRRCWVCRAG